VPLLPVQQDQRCAGASKNRFPTSLLSLSLPSTVQTLTNPVASTPHAPHIPLPNGSGRLVPGIRRAHHPRRRRRFRLLARVMRYDRYG
jgi:hypothetical protein